MGGAGKTPFTLSGGARAERMNAEEAQQRIWLSAPEKKREREREISEGPGNGNAASQVSLPEIQ